MLINVSLSFQSHGEFKQVYLQQQLKYSVSDGDVQIHTLSNVSSPSSLDWRSKGFVSSVKNQAGCASSWAFSATGALEGQYYRATRKLESFSEQQLLDCSEGYGNQGCEGGLSTNSFRYVQHQGGICTEGNYPYLGYAWFCADRYCPTIGTCSGFVEILSGSEADLLDATANEGPISVVVDSSDITFQYYSSGIYSSSKCSKRKPNHAMLVVGYGSEEGIDYWILKNRY
ncbi:Cathepsin L [Geodia barretti]|uniref:Cathepsin L n=1 Tax=Geodia barretti TaxID=519541 RepID=A0AA35T576_GEOBA|nr:Cathepsin L [Geodia barretti]